MVKRNSPTYVLDTNVLLSFPRAIYSFQDCQIVIPLTCLEELDGKKCGHTELAANARAVIRTLSGLGDLTEGAKLENGVVVKVHPEVAVKDGMKDTPDNRILACCAAVKGIMVSNDLNVRVKAMGMGLQCQEFSENSKDEEQYTGKAIFEVEPEVLIEFSAGQSLNLAGEGLMPNEVVELVSKEDPNRTTYGIFDSLTGDVRPIDRNIRPYGLYLRSEEQAVAANLLMNNSLPFVSLSGNAGSGKTLVALACALDLVLAQGKFQKILVIRNPIPVGADVGFLPGGLDEKMANWSGSITDALEILLANSAKGKGRQGKPLTIEDLRDVGVIDIQPLTYLRGRSINNTIVVCEEMQNLSAEEAKTALSRVSSNSRCFATGDVNQRDTKNSDKYSNGLAYAVNKLKEFTITAHLQLEKIERSELARIVGEVM